MMDQTGESTRQLGAIVGRTGGAVSHWRTGRYVPQGDEISRLAIHWGVNPAWIAGTSEEKYFVPVPESTTAPEAIMPHDFTETMETEDMINKFPQGATLFVKRMPEMPESAIALIELDGQRTVRRIFGKGTSCVLVAENPFIPPLFIKSAERNRMTILGRIVRVSFPIE